MMPKQAELCNKDIIKCQSFLKIDSEVLRKPLKRCSVIFRKGIVALPFFFKWHDRCSVHSFIHFGWHTAHFLFQKEFLCIFSSVFWDVIILKIYLLSSRLLDTGTHLITIYFGKSLIQMPSHQQLLHSFSHAMQVGQALTDSPGMVNVKPAGPHLS